MFPPSYKKGFLLLDMDFFNLGGNGTTKTNPEVVHFFAELNQKCYCLDTCFLS